MKVFVSVCIKGKEVESHQMEFESSTTYAQFTSKMSLEQGYESSQIKIVLVGSVPFDSSKTFTENDVVDGTTISLLLFSPPSIPSYPKIQRQVANGGFGFWDNKRWD